MELLQLYQLLELPLPVMEELKSYHENRVHELDEKIKVMIFNRKTWEEGVRKLQEFIGDDPDGIKILGELLKLCCESYDRYLQRGISAQIFFDTMKFCTRFLKEYHRIHGRYKFVWAWWFPRQVALLEFRIGCLEYEFVEGDENIISVHIPSDADLRKDAVAESLRAFYEFCKVQFPDFIHAEIYCESWILSPALKKLLEEGSNIIEFQKLFLVESVDYDSMAVLDWVFPGHTKVSESLQEDTSLQKKMKQYLMQGGKIGWARGCLQR